MAKLALYQYPSCPYCRRVLGVIDQLGVDVELRNTLKDPKHRSDLTALMGSAQVPTLMIDDKPMRESADIIKYLYDNHGDGEKSKTGFRRFF